MSLWIIYLRMTETMRSALLCVNVAYPVIILLIACKIIAIITTYIAFQYVYQSISSTHSQKSKSNLKEKNYKHFTEIK